MLDMTNLQMMIMELISLSPESLNYEEGLRKMEIQALESQLMNIHMAKLIIKQKKEILELTKIKEELETQQLRDTLFEVTMG